MLASDTRRFVHTVAFSSCFGASLSAVVWTEKVLQMMEAIVLVKALSIPLLGGIVGATVAYGGFVIYSWLPGVRWGKKYEKTCSALVMDIAGRGAFDKRHTPKLIERVRTLAQELQAYRIDCPPIVTKDPVSSDLWISFLIIVGTYAKHSKLRKARNAFDEMTPDNRREWERLNELLEEMHT